MEMDMCARKRTPNHTYSWETDSAYCIRENAIKSFGFLCVCVSGLFCEAKMCLKCVTSWVKMILVSAIFDG